MTGLEGFIMGGSLTVISILGSHITYERMLLRKRRKTEATREVNETQANAIYGSLARPHKLSEIDKTKRVIW